MKRTLLPLVALLVGCPSEDPDAGTAVGNPSLTTLAIAGGDGFSIDSATASIASIRTLDCDGSSSSEAVGEAVDLLGGTVPLRAGTWCQVIVDFDGPVIAEASWSDGGEPATLSLSVAAGSLPLVPAGSSLHSAEDRAFVLELAAPGWLDADELGVTAGADVSIDDASPLHDALAAAIENESALFEDDGDGVLAVAEREDGPVATIGEPRFEDDDAAPQAAGFDAGCSVAASPAAGWILLLPLLARRRRGILRSWRSASPRP